jgi:Uma2 family endonuclease
MSAVAQKHQYAYADYQRLRDENEGAGGLRLEYKDGVIYAMAGGTRTHGRLALRIGGIWDLALRDCCEVFPSDVSVYVEAAGLATYPDVSVVCGPIETKTDDDKVVINPTILVEVLSPSTEKYDRGDKLRDYKLLPSLRAVLLVSQHAQEITLVERTANGWQTTLARAGSTIMLEAPHVQLRVDDIYAGIELTPP